RLPRALLQSEGSSPAPDTHSSMAHVTHGARLLHSAVAMLLQKCSRLSSTPNNVLNTVESAIRMSPARSPLGGSQRQVLNSLLPASVKGCGRERSIGCLASTLTALESTVVTS